MWAYGLKISAWQCCNLQAQTDYWAVLQPSGADRLLHAPHVCSGCQIEEMIDELDLSRQIISCHPSNLPLPDHVDCFVALNGSPGRLELVAPTTLYPNVGFVYPPGSVRRLTMLSQSLLQLWAVILHPAPDATHPALFEVVL
jgi:hypothetical protein